MYVLNYSVINHTVITVTLLKFIFAPLKTRNSESARIITLFLLSVF
jgi:hypothetical protein